MVILQVPAHFFPPPTCFVHMYLFIILLLQKKIACIKLLDFLASFIGAPVKAVSVKKINYLYRDGMETSLEIIIYYNFTYFIV